jgi:hypothetical protein
MTQDTFNRAYTLLLTAFFMGVFLFGFFTGKSVNWEYIFGFIIPAFSHVVNQIVGVQIATANIHAKASTEVAAITTGTPNGVKSVSSGGLEK